MKFLVIFYLGLTLVSGSAIDSPYSVDTAERSFNQITTKVPKFIDDNERRISQCTYDYKGLRLNKGCVAESEEPLICQRGELVLKTFDDDSEMCCCNFSKLDKEKI